MTGRIDITGQRFGRWQALARVAGTQRWMCRCDCGTERSVTSANLRYGVSKSCGCTRSEMLRQRNRSGNNGSTGGKPKDIAGRTYGRWTVLTYEGRQRWRCRCRCGTEKVITKATLKISKSCGCARDEGNHSRAVELLARRAAAGRPTMSRNASAEERAEQERAYRKWKYATDPGYRSRVNRQGREYLKTPRGRAISARKNARRWGLIESMALFTAREWDEMLQAWGNRCAYCGLTAEKLTRDHVVALHLGGKHDSLNIVPACQRCNTKKSDKPIGRALAEFGVDADDFWATMEAAQQRINKVMS